MRRGRDREEWIRWGRQVKKSIDRLFGERVCIPRRGQVGQIGRSGLVRSGVVCLTGFRISMRSPPAIHPWRSDGCQESRVFNAHAELCKSCGYEEPISLF